MIDIRTHNHNEGHGFDLIFHFENENNPYFDNDIIKKKLFISKSNHFELTESNLISWEENKNLTKKKVKKKGVSKLIEQDSFFNFFKRVQMSNK